MAKANSQRDLSALGNNLLSMESQSKLKKDEDKNLKQYMAQRWLADMEHNKALRAQNRDTEIVADLDRIKNENSLSKGSAE